MVVKRLEPPIRVAALMLTEPVANSKRGELRPGNPEAQLSKSSPADDVDRPVLVPTRTEVLGVRSLVRVAQLTLTTRVDAVDLRSAEVTITATR